MVSHSLLGFSGAYAHAGASLRGTNVQFVQELVSQAFPSGQRRRNSPGGLAGGSLSLITVVHDPLHERVCIGLNLLLHDRMPSTETIASNAIER